MCQGGGMAQESIWYSIVWIYHNAFVYFTVMEIWVVYIKQFWCYLLGVRSHSNENDQITIHDNMDESHEHNVEQKVHTRGVHITHFYQTKLGASTSCLGGKAGGITLGWGAPERSTEASWDTGPVPYLHMSAGDTGMFTSWKVAELYTSNLCISMYGDYPIVTLTLKTKSMPV